MSVDPANPYAPPVHEASGPDVERKWSAGGGILQVRDGACLPRVDLLSAATDDDLIPVLRRFQSRRLIVFLALMPVLSFALAAIFIGPRYFPAYGSAMTPIAMIVLAVIVRILRKRAGGGTLVRYYASRDSLKREARFFSRIRWIAVALELALVVSALSARHGGQFDRFIIFVLCALGVFLTLVLVVHFRVRPYCSGTSGDWAQLSRIDPRAIEQLDAVEKKAHAECAPPRKVPVYRLYPFRMPLKSVFNRYWLNPLAAMLVLLRRLFTRKFGVDYLHESAAEIIAPSQLPATLVELARPWISSPAAWQLTRARRLESPSGGSLRETLDLTTPDLCHSLQILIVTQVISGRFMPVTVWLFSTQLQDGAVVRTSTRGASAAVPGIEFHWAFCDPHKAWARHLAFVGDRTIQPVASAEEWFDRLMQWGEAIHTAHRAAGYEEPVREIVLPAV